MTVKVKVGDTFALVDDADFELVHEYTWHLHSEGYAVWRGRVNGKNKYIRMHRLIAGTPAGMDTDHKNRNRLDNRRSNLRHATRKENLMNTARHLNAKGYYYERARDKWVVDSQAFGVFKRFNTEQEAKNFYAETKARYAKG